MKRVFGTLRICIAGCAALTALAQTQIDLRTQSKSVDFTAAKSTKPVRMGNTLPASCSAGELFFLTVASNGNNLYGCSAANTWSVQGAPANLNVENDGTLIGSRGTANFITGTGLMSVMTDDGSSINIQSALDTAVVQTQPGEQSGTALLCASTTHSSSSYQCGLNPTAAAYRTGMVLHWIPDVNGAGGPTTLNVDTLGPAPLRSADGASDPAATDIVAGRLYPVWYDGAAFRFLSSNTAVAPGLSDPGADGIVYRSAAGTAIPATADNISAALSCEDTGAANTYTCNLIPAISAYRTGTTYWFLAANGNTGPSAVSFNSLPYVSLKKYGGMDLSAGDIKAGQWVMVIYDGRNMQMQSQLGTSPGGAVSTVFGRSGSVAAQSGDYTAAQISNAVDQTASYSNPSWITSLSWSKLSEIPLAFAPSPHAASHQDGGSDEIGLSTPTAHAIPKADSSGKLAAGWIPALNQNTTGNAATATALAATPSKCSAGYYPLGIDAQGNAQTCTAAGSVSQIKEAVTTVTVAASPYAVASSDAVVVCDASGGPVTINLPATSGTHRELTIKKTDSTANGCILTRAGSDLIDGVGTLSITNQYSVVKVLDRATGVWDRMHVAGYNSRTLDLTVGGNYINASGPYYAWNLKGTGFNGSGGNDFTSVTVPATGTPYMVKTFRWPTDWDNTQPVSILVATSDSGGNGGNFKVDFSVVCAATGTSIGGTPTYGAVLSTGAWAFSPVLTIKEFTLSGLSIGTCGPNSLGLLKLARDNTVTGNSTDGLGIHDVALLYSAK